MPVFDPTLTADKVASTIPTDALNASGKSEGTPDFVTTKGYYDATRKRRSGPLIPQDLDIDKAHLKARVRIFNVGPWPHVIPLGSIGTAIIPACPEDKPYVEMMTPLHELVKEFYPINNRKEWKELREEGRKMAIEILGEGRNQDRKQSKRNVGVFIAAGEIPTQKEIADANKALIPHCKQMVAQMDHLWDRDRKLAYDVFNPETFGKAARILQLTGKEKPWLNTDTPIDAFKCPACMIAVDPAAPICFNCKGIVNEEAWLTLEAKRQSLMDAAIPKKGK